MKKLFIIMMMAGFALWQPANGQRLRSEWIKMPIALPAADEFYGKDKRFQKVIPENIETLALLTEKYAGGFFARLLFSCPITAKTVNEKKGETPDVVFELVSPGIQNVMIGQPYFAEYNNFVAGSMNERITIPTKGFIADITYNFPMKIVVKDGQGNLKRTIIVSDETEIFRMPYHAAYFKELDMNNKLLIIPAVGFATANDCAESLEKTDEKIIITRTAKNQLEILFKACSEAIRICYDNYLSRKNFIVYIKRLHEWNDAANTALSDAVDRQKAALQITFDGTSMSSLSESLQPVISLYENYLNEYGATVKAVRELCLYNLLSVCYFSGDFDKAAQYYEAYYREFGSRSRELDDFFNKIYAWYRLRQSDTVYFATNFIESVEETVNEERREIARQQAIEAQEAREAAYRELHIRGNGTVTGVNGEKYNGEVSMDLVSEGGILNLDAGRLVSLRSENDFRTFKLNAFTEVEVDGAVYRPVKKASRLLSSSSILKVVHQKGKYSLLYDPASKVYYLKSEAQEKAYPVRDVQQMTKLGEEFYQSCSALKTELSGSKTSVDVDGLKELTEKIAQLCQ
jgi:hypothetical protein